MGYRSDVLVAVACDTSEHMDELFAVYRTHPMVQKHSLAEQFKRVSEADEAAVAYVHLTSAKWYEFYEDVQGFEHILRLAETFGDEREWAIATLFIRVGEDTTDIVYEEHRSNKVSNGGGWEVYEALDDRFRLQRRIEVNGE